MQVLGLVELVIFVTYLEIGLSCSVKKQPQKSYKSKTQSRQWCKKRRHGKEENLERTSLFFYKMSKQTKPEKLSWSILFCTEKLFGGEENTKKHNFMSMYTRWTWICQTVWMWTDLHSFGLLVKINIITKAKITMGETEIGFWTIYYSKDTATLEGVEPY